MSFAGVINNSTNGLYVSLNPPPPDMDLPGGLVVAGNIAVEGTIEAVESIHLVTRPSGFPDVTLTPTTANVNGPGGSQYALGVNYGLQVGQGLFAGANVQIGTFAGGNPGGGEFQVWDDESTVLQIYNEGGQGIIQSQNFNPGPLAIAPNNKQPILIAGYSGVNYAQQQPGVVLDVGPTSFPAWVATSAYTVGQKVNYDDLVWTCVTAQPANSPAPASPLWSSSAGGSVQVNGNLNVTGNITGTIALQTSFVPIVGSPVVQTGPGHDSYGVIFDPTEDYFPFKGISGVYLFKLNVTNNSGGSLNILNNWVIQCAIEFQPDGTADIYTISTTTSSNTTPPQIAFGFFGYSDATQVNGYVIGVSSTTDGSNYFPVTAPNPVIVVAQNTAVTSGNNDALTSISACMKLV